MKRSSNRIVALLILSMFLITGCGNGEKEKLALRDTAIGQMDAGDYEGAIKTFAQALEASDGLVGEFEMDVLKYRAEAEMCVGDYSAAAATYDILGQVDGEKTEYLTREFIMYVMADRLDEALETYHKAYGAKASGEEYDQGILLLGKELEDAGRLDEARTIYQTAMNEGSRSGELYNRMALCEMEAGAYDQALVYLNQGLQTGDGDARAMLLYNQAAVYEQKLEFGKALEILEQYAAEFGATPEVEKELAFLRTR